MPQQQEPVLDRPFYIIIVLWGEQFRNYFLRYCLPSLLAPGNVPALATKTRSKLLLATRPEDWAAMRETAIFHAAERYLDFIYLEIPPCPPGKMPVDHMGAGHLLACNIAFRDKAYGVFLTPDVMLSEGTMARVQALVREGAELVQVAALRLGEEPFFSRLTETGLLSEGNHSLTGVPISISGGDFVNVGLWSLHSETLSYEWSSPCFCQPFNILMPSAAWWRVPGEDALIIHSLSFASLAFDYAAVEKHDTTALETAQLDADYVYKNLGHSKAIVAIHDSDEAFLAGWTPLAAKPHPLVANPSYTNRYITWIAKGARFRQVFYGGFFDPLKQRMFFETIRWHTGIYPPIGKHIERRAMRAIRLWVDPPGERAKLWAKAVRWLAPHILRIHASWALCQVRLTEMRKLYAQAWQHPDRATQALKQSATAPVGRVRSRVLKAAASGGDIWARRGAVARLLGRALQGDKEALQRIAARFRFLGSRTKGP